MAAKNINSLSKERLIELCNEREVTINNLKADRAKQGQAASVTTSRLVDIDNQCLKILNYLGVTDESRIDLERTEARLNRIMEILMPLVTTRLKALDEVKALHKKVAALSWLAEKEFEASEASVAYWRKALQEYVTKEVSSR